MGNGRYAEKLTYASTNVQSSLQFLEATSNCGYFQSDLWIVPSDPNSHCYWNAVGRIAYTIDLVLICFS